MNERSVTHSTFVIERNYPVAPERVFAAFADPAVKVRWFAVGDSRENLSFHSDFRVGGSEQSIYRMKEGTPFPGAEVANQTTYQDIIPNTRIVVAYTMALNGRIFSASLATFEFAPAGAGTTLTFTEQGAYFEGSDGPKMREAGWGGILKSLAAELGR